MRVPQQVFASWDPNHRAQAGSGSDLDDLEFGSGSEDAEQDAKPVITRTAHRELTKQI